MADAAAAEGTQGAAASARSPTGSTSNSTTSTSSSITITGSSTTGACSPTSSASGLATSATTSSPTAGGKNFGSSVPTGTPVSSTSYGSSIPPATPGPSTSAGAGSSVPPATPGPSTSARAGSSVPPATPGPSTGAAAGSSVPPATSGPSTSTGAGSSIPPSTPGPSTRQSQPQPSTSSSNGPYRRVPTFTDGSGVLPPVKYEGYKGNMDDYCKQHEDWLKRAYWQRECATSAYYKALSLMFPASRSSGPAPAPAPGGPGTVPQPAGWPNPAPDLPGRPAGINNNNVAAWNLNFPRVGGPENPIVRRFVVRGIRTNNNTFAIDFNIAPIWKRFLAECIDFMILLMIKLFVTLTIIDNFDLIDLDNIDLDALQEAGNLVDMAWALTWELVILEFTHRIVVCFFEAYCLAKGGATPGKSVMALRVLHCENVIPLPNNAGPGQPPSSRVLVSPGSFLTFPRALVRSTVKNFSLAFFFPLCFTLFHFEHNRTLYDLSAKSIVVEIRPIQ